MVEYIGAGGNVVEKSSLHARTKRPSQFTGQAFGEDEIIITFWNQSKHIENKVHKAENVRIIFLLSCEFIVGYQWVFKVLTSVPSYIVLFQIIFNHIMNFNHIMYKTLLSKTGANKVIQIEIQKLCSAYISDMSLWGTWMVVVGNKFCMKWKGVQSAGMRDDDWEPVAYTSTPGCTAVDPLGLISAPVWRSYVSYTDAWILSMRLVSLLAVYCLPCTLFSSCCLLLRFSVFDISGGKN